MRIATPEGVDLELVLAGLGSRTAARAVDLTLIGVLLSALAIALGLAGAFEADPEPLAVAGFLVAAFTVLFGYDVLFETLGAGRTPGKRLIRLRVLRAGGQPIGLGSSAVRNLLRLVDGAALLWVPSIVSILASVRNQRLGDIAAGTIVVHDGPGAASPRAAHRSSRGRLPGRRSSRPAAAASPTEASAPGQSHLPLEELAGWDASAVTLEELATVRGFLGRRWSLRPEARADLARELAARLAVKVEAPSRELSPEDFLERLAAVKAARR